MRCSSAAQAALQSFGLSSPAQSGFCCGLTIAMEFSGLIADATRDGNGDSLIALEIDAAIETEVRPSRDRTSCLRNILMGFPRRSALRAGEKITKGTVQVFNQCPDVDFACDCVKPYWRTADSRSHNRHIIHFCWRLSCQSIKQRAPVLSAIFAGSEE